MFGTPSSILEAEEGWEEKENLYQAAG